MSEVKFSKEHEWITLRVRLQLLELQNMQLKCWWYSFCWVARKRHKCWKRWNCRCCRVYKSASDVYTPISGEVVDINQTIVDDPAKINEDPEGAAWFFKLKIKDASELDSLMNKEEYEKFAKETSS